MNSTNYLKASKNPIDDINAVAYEGQPIENRLYKTGYEDYFEMLPNLTDEDPHLLSKVQLSKGIMNSLSHDLKNDPWTNSLPPLPGGFNRTILAIEEPVKSKEGREIVLARWGDGKTSPVHGHADGLLYEKLLTGMMRVNTYRITDHVKRLVRPIETVIYKGFADIAAGYTRKQEFTRSALVHNFTSIGYSSSLHYVPEHTRDGRDNSFKVEYFDRHLPFYLPEFKQLNAQQGLDQLRMGDVALVRSENVPEYGDHWIVITGKPILKEHGLRPQDIAIFAPHSSSYLDRFNPIMGITLLKLDDQSAKAFHSFHGIDATKGRVIFPTA